MKRLPILAAIGALTLVLPTLACSGGNAGGPTSPSVFGSSSSAPTGGTTIIGTTSGLTSSLANRQPATATVSTASGVQVCVNGTCANLDEDGRFELRGEFSGDVGLEVAGLEGSSILLTIPGVSEGETIVVRLEIDDSTSRIEILSRTLGDGDSPDDDLNEDDPSVDSPSADAPSEHAPEEDSTSEDSTSEDDTGEDNDSGDDASGDDASEDDGSDGLGPAQP
jgi:hypothetical protein